MAMDSEQLDALLNSTLDDFDEDAPVPEQNVQVAGNIIHLDDDAGGYTCEDQILTCVQALEGKYGADDNFDRIRSLIEGIRRRDESRSIPQEQSSSKAHKSAKKTDDPKGKGETKSVLKKGFFNSSSASSKPASSASKGKEPSRTSPEKPPQDGKSVEASVDEALASLLKNTENLNEMPSGLPQSEEDAKKMIDELMAQMGAGAGMPGAGAGADVSPDMMSQMMEPMMESLFSKDILYPSLKEVSEQYPKWLEENRPKLDAVAYGQYEQQYAKMQEMCGVYEDSGIESKAQIKKVLALMEEMSSYGSPPESIMKSLGVQLGPDGMPKMPSLPGMPGGGENCSIM